MIEKIDLKMARIHSKMTTSEVAKAMKKSQTWVTQSENGTRRISGEDLIKLFTIYKLEDTPLNQIFLPKKIAKCNKRIARVLRK